MRLIVLSCQVCFYLLYVGSVYVVLALLQIGTLICEGIQIINGLLTGDGNDSN